MTYRGIVNNGVVVIDGEKLGDGTIVDVTPVASANAGIDRLRHHPAVGIWKDRADLPEDSADAVKLLRQTLMRRDDE